MTRAYNGFLSSQSCETQIHDVVKKRLLFERRDWLMYTLAGIPTTLQAADAYKQRPFFADSRELSKAHAECRRLEQEVMGLRRDLEACRTESKESTEQANMANIQNQLLIDMVRVRARLRFSHHTR